MTQNPDALAWTVPVMRLGWIGRGLTYLVVAGVSLWAVTHGGRAEGAGGALARLEAAPGGRALIGLIAVGLVAYGLWQLLAAALDLDAKGSELKGIASRVGQAVSGLIYLGLAVGAFGLLRGQGADSGDSGLERGVATVLGWPAGRWLVGLAALAIAGVGIKYLRDGWTARYERMLRSTATSARLRPALRIGVAAHGVTLLIVAALFSLAAWRSSAEEAGGLDGAFDWLSTQPSGRTLVILLCLGLLAFGLWCLVNARWRVVPRVAGDKTETLARAVRSLAA